MDITSLLAVLSPLLKPYLHKGLEDFSGEAGKTLWAAIKKPFTADHEKIIIASAEAGMADIKTQQDLLGLVRLQLEKSSDYANSLKQVSQQYNGDTNLQINQYGEKSVALKDNWGNITIN